MDNIVCQDQTENLSIIDKLFHLYADLGWDDRITTVKWIYHIKILNIYTQSNGSVLLMTPDKSPSK